MSEYVIFELFVIADFYDVVPECFETSFYQLLSLEVSFKLLRTTIYI